VFETERLHYVTFWIRGLYVSGDARVNAPDEMSKVGWFDRDALPSPLFLSLRNLVEGRSSPGDAYARLFEVET
jgi:hypothetical protein